MPEIQKNLLTALGGLASGALALSKAKAEESEELKKSQEEKRKAYEYQMAAKKEAEDTALEADIVRMGGDPEATRNFMNARSLGLDTKGFGMIQKNGKFVGSYSSLAERLSKGALADSLTSKVINEKGFSERVLSLGGTRRGRVEALVEASKGGKK